MENIEKPKLEIRQTTEQEKEIEAGEIKGLELLIAHYKEENQLLIPQIETIRSGVSAMLAVYITCLGFIYPQMKDFSKLRILALAISTIILIGYWAYIYLGKRDYGTLNFYEIRDAELDNPNLNGYSTKEWQVLDNFSNKYKIIYDHNARGLEILLKARNQFIYTLLLAFSILVLSTILPTITMPNIF